MLRAVPGVERLVRPGPLGEVGPVRPAPAVLGEATVHSPTHPFEQALREALISLKEGLARVQAESDPLARHLGYRALDREATDGKVDPEQLSRPDEQQWARELLQTVHREVGRSALYLDDAARVDLEVLLRWELRRHEREDAEARRAAALHVEQLEHASARRVVEEVERTEQTVSRLAPPRPGWQRAAGVLLAALGLIALGLVVGQPGLLAKWWRGLPSVRWGSLLGGLGAALAGAWLAVDPQQRRAWLVRRLLELAELRRTASEREAAALEALTRAKKLFEEVDAECQREEAAALAVLQRRPGAERYVSLTAPVVVPSAG